ncbi:hypothetical protein [Gemmata sp.]|uniref:hypothetical protein n=1 Tax=Gemmata sp. TaxID=1914242 RepID=UPI003F730CDA
MAFVVVRCTGCRGPARVGSAGLGTAVECPRCRVVFQAVEEATLVVPGAGWVPPNPPPPLPWRGPSAPAVRGRDDDDEHDGDFDDEGGESHEAAGTGDPVPDHKHDPAGEDADGPLPASVFIGLALLPFLVPIVWSVAAVVFPKQPVLTVGTPLALAVTASTLCLAVISTIDWRPATRVKGVLLLVVLSYTAGVGLYFLTKDTANRVRRLVGTEHPLVSDAPKDGGFRVKVPTRAADLKESPLAGVPLACRQAVYAPGLQDKYTFTYGSTPKPAPKQKPQVPPVGSDPWFDAVTAELFKQVGQRPHEPRRLEYGGQTAGREVELHLQDGKNVRLVRVYAIEGRVYYLAVQHASMDPGDDDLAQEFFESFEVQ